MVRVSFGDPKSKAPLGKQGGSGKKQHQINLKKSSHFFVEIKSERKVVGRSSTLQFFPNLHSELLKYFSLHSRGNFECCK